MIITIDGPTASGKSSTARELAQQLHFFHINSGLLYRSLSWLALKQCSMNELATLSFEKINSLQNQLTYYGVQGKGQVLWEGKDITSLLKTPTIDKAASILGANKYAREVVLHWQTKLVDDHGNSVVEGRDAGSVVFPNAENKFFLTANLTVRAERWLKDQKNKGNDFTLETALKFVKDRDDRDTKRIVAPLRIPDDAIIIDNSEMNLKQTVEKIEQLINGALLKK